MINNNIELSVYEDDPESEKEKKNHTLWISHENYAEKTTTWVDLQDGFDRRGKKTIFLIKEKENKLLDFKVCVVVSLSYVVRFNWRNSVEREREFWCERKRWYVKVWKFSELEISGFEKNNEEWSEIEEQVLLYICVLCLLLR